MFYDMGWFVYKFSVTDIRIKEVIYLFYNPAMVNNLHELSSQTKM